MKGLYIHIPFCRQKCLYCDFISLSGKEHLIPEYLSALAREAEKYRGAAVDTVFIGGGTPSLLGIENIYSLFDIVYKNFSVERDAEITAEVNPESADEEKIKAFADAGVNRISMGVQSFNDAELAALGRIHNSKTAYNAACIVKKYINNFNMDIITGIPHQTPDTLLNTLETAMSLMPMHLSCYSLIIEEGTPFFDIYKDKALLPDEDTDRDMYHFTCNFLNKNGYKRYEISNFSKPGAECRHNLKYWSCNEYIGLGAAAHSYINFKRFYNTSCITDYINGNTIFVECENLSEKDRIFEFIIMGLRKADGINLAEFYNIFGTDILSLFSKEISRHIKNGFLEEENGFLRLTQSGIDVSNTILCDFV